MQKTLPILTFLLLLLYSCTQNSTPTQNTNAIVLRYTLDTAGNISDSFPEVKQQLKAIADRVNSKADKVMIRSYTEKMNTPEESNEVAQKQALAAKNYMLPLAERIYYNVGIEVKGYTDPIDANHPTSPINRRIEIVPM